MCMRFIFVALGGAVGAMGRYAISLIPIKTGFPVLTLITNIAGAILIGFIVGIVNLREDISPIQRCFGKPAYAADLQRSQHFLWKRFLCWKEERIGREGSISR